MQGKWRLISLAKKEEEDIEIIGITFVSKNLFYKRCLIDKYTS